MGRSKQKIKVGILGCGAIGSGIAKSISNELKELCQLSGLFDIDHQKATVLEQSLSQSNIVKTSIAELVNDCDLMVEAVSAKDTREAIKQAIEAKKDVLAMSIGKLLDSEDIFALAEKNGCSILLPSGAIAGLDAIKSASLVNISQITLTTRKPTKGLANTPYIEKQGIDLSSITDETIVFEGNVREAVVHFPKNINVAAALALASKMKEKLLIKIITSPDYTTNSHEVEVIGDFGRLITRTENKISPDNPKTSYLAVLSGIQTLKGFCSSLKIGT